MSFLLLITVGAAVFLVRDALLLRTSTRRGLALYALGATAVFAALGVVSETVSRDQAVDWLRNPNIWIPAVAVHGIYWLGTLLARRSRVLLPWVLLLPSPMYVFSAGGLAWFATQLVSGMDGWLLGILLGAAWGAAATLLSRLAAQGTWNPLEFSAAANLTATLLIPLHQEAQEGSQQAPVDWMATLLPLASVAGLVALSFAVHRYRSSRHAAHS
jgi:hypothetical protein